MRPKTKRQKKRRRQTLCLAVGPTPAIGTKAAVPFILLDAGASIKTETGVAGDNLNVADVPLKTDVTRTSEVDVLLVIRQIFGGNHTE